jgi:hypothetical protein
MEAHEKGVFGKVLENCYAMEEYKMRVYWDGISV